MRRLVVPAFLSLFLAACGSSHPLADAGKYVGGTVPLECAPFARALTGVALRGDAASWWDAAAGRYDRGHAPRVGSVLVLTRSSRLPYGHVAVVSHLLERRKILVTQANWVHHRVTEDQAVIDVSPANGRSPPSGSATVSSRRSDVVPTATTRPPAFRVAAMAATVSGPISPNSACIR